MSSLRGDNVRGDSQMTAPSVVAGTGFTIVVTSITKFSYGVKTFMPGGDPRVKRLRLLTHVHAAGMNS